MTIYCKLINKDEYAEQIQYFRITDGIIEMYFYVFGHDFMFVKIRQDVKILKGAIIISEEEFYEETKNF